MAAFGFHTHREISKKRNKMSKHDEKHTSELSMEELDNVAGGGATVAAADSTRVAPPVMPPVVSPAPAPAVPSSGDPIRSIDVTIGKKP
jgi:hypothetical protein